MIEEGTAVVRIKFTKPFERDHKESFNQLCEAIQQGLVEADGEIEFMPDFGLTVENHEVTNG